MPPGVSGAVPLHFTTMKKNLLLSEPDHARLLSLLNEEVPRPTGTQREALEAFLSRCATASRPEAMEDRVGLGDRVTLISPLDPDDWIELEIVPPAEADLDADRIPVTAPISLAVLGHSSGDPVAWEAPGGVRKMLISAVRKRALTV